jgi:hypothetical protein
MYANENAGPGLGHTWITLYLYIHILDTKHQIKHFAYDWLVFKFNTNVYANNCEAWYESRMLTNHSFYRWIDDDSAWT